MARPVYVGRINADAVSGTIGMATVGSTTVYMEISDGGGGETGPNTLTITAEGIPNPNDSAAAQVQIEDDTGVWPALVIADTDLPYNKIIHLTGTNYGTMRFNFDYEGAGTIYYVINIWMNP